MDDFIASTIKNRPEDIAEFGYKYFNDLRYKVKVHIVIGFFNFIIDSFIFIEFSDRCKLSFTEK